MSQTPDVRPEVTALVGNKGKQTRFPLLKTGGQAKTEGQMREKVSCQVKHIKIELLVLRLVFLVKGHTKKKKKKRKNAPREQWL